MIYGLDLFSGIGGISIALAPWVRTVAYCEADRYATAVLLSRMERGDIEAAPIWDDVRTLKGAMLPHIDIIFGGFPCQDISTAGRGAGLEGERSGLFFEIVRLARELEPAFIFLENVPAITARGGVAVVRTLTELGYDCRWTILSAASVGAPQSRRRWFLLAYSDRNRPQGREIQGAIQKSAQTMDEQLSRFLQADPWDAGAVSRIYGSGDGIPFRSHRIKCLGNSVVPLCAREAFKTLIGIK